MQMRALSQEKYTEGLANKTRKEQTTQNPSKRVVFAETSFGQQAQTIRSAEN